MASPSPRLSGADWAQAGFEALIEEGLEGVAVEKVAVRLGATKGSFYWHFANRDALVKAVLDLWDAETEEAIDTLHKISDPVQRMRQLLDLVLSEIPTAHAEIDLLSNTAHPLVAQAVQQVSRRRIDYISGTLRQAGLGPTAATDAAVHTYALWIGLLQVQRALPESLPNGRARQRFLRTTGALLEQLLPNG